MDWVLSDSWHSPVCISTTLLFLLGGGTGTPVTTMGTGGSSLTAITEGAEGDEEGEGEVLCLISAVLLVLLGQPYLVKVYGLSSPRVLVVGLLLLLSLSPPSWSR